MFWRRFGRWASAEGDFWKVTSPLPDGEEKTRRPLLTSQDTPPIDHAPMTESFLRMTHEMMHVWKPDSHLLLHLCRDCQRYPGNWVPPCCSCSCLHNKLIIKAEGTPFGCVPVIILLITQCIKWNVHRLRSYNPREIAFFLTRTHTNGGIFSSVVELVAFFQDIAARKIMQSFTSDMPYLYKYSISWLAWIILVDKTNINPNIIQGAPCTTIINLKKSQRQMFWYSLTHLVYNKQCKKMANSCLGLSVWLFCFFH